MSALLLIVMGAVLEGLPAVVILLPTFLPVVKQFEIDVIHYSIVVVAATGIGLFVPPITVGLFIACAVAGISVDRAVRPILLYILFLCLGLVLVIPCPLADTRAAASVWLGIGTQSTSRASPVLDPVAQIWAITDVL